MSERVAGLRENGWHRDEEIQAFEAAFALLLDYADEQEEAGRGHVANVYRERAALLRAIAEGRTRSRKWK